MVRVRNTRPTLAAEFADYAVFIKARLSEIDVPSLWSAGSGLNEFVRALGTRPAGSMTEALEPEVLGDLRALVRDHAAFILGFATGQVLTVRAQALHDADRPPREIAAAVMAVLHAMIARPRLLATKARHLVRSLTRALEELEYWSLPLVSGGYETGKNGLIAMGRTLHPTLVLAGAADVARILAGDVQADTLRTALLYFHENAKPIVAFAVSDSQMREWLEWLTVRTGQLLKEFNDEL